MSIKELTAKLVDSISTLSLDEKVAALNDIRQCLHEISPFRDEPVDFVKWVKSESVQANDYNPNSVAPPEMELLKLSILSDGYTQPVVSWPRDEHWEVVDGFHRNRVCKSLLRNDYWCKGLGFSQHKSDAYQKYLDLMKRRKAQAGFGGV